MPHMSGGMEYSGEKHSAHSPQKGFLQVLEAAVGLELLFPR